MSYIVLDIFGIVKKLVAILLTLFFLFYKVHCDKTECINIVFTLSLVFLEQISLKNFQIPISLSVRYHEDRCNQE
jgi:hypothetical protein